MDGLERLSLLLGARVDAVEGFFLTPALPPSIEADLVEETDRRLLNAY